MKVISISGEDISLKVPNTSGITDWVTRWNHLGRKCSRGKKVQHRALGATLTFSAWVKEEEPVTDRAKELPAR